jgi:hypothetical protein
VIIKITPDKLEKTVFCVLFAYTDIRILNGTIMYSIAGAGLLNLGDLLSFLIMIYIRIDALRITH